MDFHPAANIFPMMSTDEFNALVQDINDNGQREPIYTWQGQIIDGRNRYKACEQLGIAPHTKEWNGQGSLVGFVLSLNLNRRHLSSSQKAAVAVEILPMLEQEAAERRKATEGRPSNQEKLAEIFPEVSTATIVPGYDKGEAAGQAARFAGTNSHYVRDAKKLKEESPVMFEQVRAGSLTIGDAKKQIKRQEREQVLEDRREQGKEQIRSNGRYDVRTAACIEALNLPAASVDWLITDPPYPKDFLKVYEDLSEVAAHVLKPGASMLCMVGQSYLPEVIRMLGKHMSYHWTLAYLTPGGQATQLFQRNVNTFWKPVLWYVNGVYSGEWIGDVTRSAMNNNDKEHHHWGQSESGMADLMGRFVKAGDMVFDPFLGGGTTGVVALEMGAGFIGFDVSDNAVNTSLARFAEVS